MFDIFKLYLNDKNEYIIISSNELYIKGYTKINSINDFEVDILMNKYKVLIKGYKLYLSTIKDNELLIKGDISSIEKIY